MRDKVPALDLPLVLQGLRFTTVSATEQVDLDLLMIETGFQLSICSAERVSELQSLVCLPTFLCSH